MPVVAKAKISPKSREYLQRLSVVYAYEIRLTAVTELFLREMSPTQFYREFGGGSPTRVERHFKRLAEYGWLRLVREEAGGRRRGGREHFYRANELAILDEEICSLLPPSVRAAFVWRTLKQLAERVNEALEAGTFDARPDRRQNSTSLYVDQIGWDGVEGAVNAVFESHLGEQREARLRIYESGEKPFLVTSALAAFESPVGPWWLEGGSELPEGAECLAPEALRLAKVFDDEVSLCILWELNLREMSVTQYYDEIGGAEKSAIRHRFNILKRFGWLVRVGKRPGCGRRGPAEDVYRAAGPALAGDGAWVSLSHAVNASDSWKAFERVADHAKEAIRAGTFGICENSHVTWSLLLLDQRGWENVIAAVETCQKFIAEEQERAAARLAESGEAPIKMTVAMMAFESPKNSTKAP